MFTALLILAAILLLVALVGVCCQVCGGGFWAVFHLMNGSVELLLKMLAEVLTALLSALAE